MEVGSPCPLSAPQPRASSLESGEGGEEHRGRCSQMLGSVVPVRSRAEDREHEFVPSTAKGGGEGRSGR